MPRIEFSPDIVWLNACEHITGTGYLFERMSRKTRYAHSKRSFFISSCHGLLKCGRCGSEYEEDVRKLGRDATAIVVTKWFCVGSGLTPYESQWRRRGFHGDGGPRIYKADDSVRSVFERGAERSSAQLSMDNERLYHERRLQWLSERPSRTAVEYRDEEPGLALS
ncbi:tyrosine protein phosphatase 1 [Elasticomyces elasticus]|nr:tyrosine protein phosphatase 1 [Elasticomyces elasticus]